MEKEERILRPSLLSADFSALGREIDEMISLNIKDCHYDVMDGTFVSDISFGEPVYKSLMKRYQGRIAFDVHLMCVDPLRHVKEFYKAGAREISFHFEAFDKNMEEIRKLREEMPDLKLGIAFSPCTEVSDVLPYLSLFDSVLVMSVVPGKGGQSYILGSEDKIQALSSYRKEKGLSYQIGVDGGINSSTCSLVYSHGADWMVCGSYYFKAQDRKALLEEFSSSLGGRKDD